MWSLISSTAITLIHGEITNSFSHVMCEGTAYGSVGACTRIRIETTPCGNAFSTERDLASLKDLLTTFLRRCPILATKALPRFFTMAFGSNTNFSSHRDAEKKVIKKGLSQYCGQRPGGGSESGHPASSSLSLSAAYKSCLSQIRCNCHDPRGLDSTLYFKLSSR